MDIISLAGWSIFGLILIAVWQRVAPSGWRLGGSAGGGVHKVSAFTVIFAVLLTLALVFLFNQIWGDIGNLVKSQPSPSYPGRYQYKSDLEFQDAWNAYNEAVQAAERERGNVELQRLFIHTAFVVPVIIIALIIFLTFYRRGTAYAAVTLPYFIAALTITIRLLFDAGSWVISEYQKLGIYIVLGTLIVVFSILTVLVQAWWQRKHKIPGSPSGSL